MQRLAQIINEEHVLHRYALKNWSHHLREYTRYLSQAQDLPASDMVTQLKCLRQWISNSSPSHNVQPPSLRLDMNVEFAVWKSDPDIFYFLSVLLAFVGSGFDSCGVDLENESRSLGD